MLLSGRCYCGRCSWEAHGNPNWVCHCHCESCRKNCAAAFTTFFGINNGCWRWAGAEPKEVNTSTGVSRYFCAKCGTPMGYYNSRWSHEVHFYVASMDAPFVLAPQFHVHWQEKVSWLSIDDDLPKFMGSADDGEQVYE